MTHWILITATFVVSLSAVADTQSPLFTCIQTASDLAAQNKVLVEQNRSLKASYSIVISEEGGSSCQPDLVEQCSKTNGKLISFQRPKASLCLGICKGE